VDLGLGMDELDLRRVRAALASALVAWALAVATSVAAPAPAAAAGNLVRNPMLSAGRGSQPNGWSRAAYVMKPEVTRFTWTRGPQGIGVLQIQNLRPNDARWVQKVPVSPSTWYRVSGWIRTLGVGAAHKGAYLSVMGTFHDSEDVRGTQGWRPVGFWVKTGSLDTSLEIGCRLGGYSSLNTGMAFFTGISVEAAGTPAPERFVYGGEPTAGGTGGALWAQVVGGLVVIGLVLLLWRYVVPRSGQIPP